MPTGLKVVAAINVVAIALLAAFAVKAGGGFHAGDFPPEHQIVLEPVEPALEAAPAPSLVPVRTDIPAEFRRVEAQAPRWEEGTDGRIRLID
ncbi:MAG: hypothetical protein IPL06_02145 [Betaproteobacteria bacterium]|nr:hypothetical protein [Betaproteobacteria bacterium]